MTSQTLQQILSSLAGYDYKPNMSIWAILSFITEFLLSKIDLLSSQVPENRCVFAYFWKIIGVKQLV